MSNNPFCFCLEHLECFLFLQATCFDIIDSPVDRTTSGMVASPDIQNWKHSNSSWQLILLKC
jgi:hypothetical protein